MKRRMMVGTNEPNASDAPWRELEAAARMVRTPCGDGEMTWRVWDGPGDPLVLLHGGAGSWTHWLRTIPAFLGERTLLVPDLPGLGDSAKPPPGSVGPAVASIVADGLVRVMDPGKPFDIAGFSFGGVVATLVAANGPPRPRSLTLVGSGGLGVIHDPRNLKKIRNTEGAEREAAHRFNLAAWMIADPGRIDDEAIAIQDWNSERSRYDTRPVGQSGVSLEALPRVPCPVTGIWGGEDQPVQGDTARVRAALMGVRPDAAFHVVPGAGHWVAFEDPDVFLPVFRQGLARMGGGRAQPLRS